MLKTYPSDDCVGDRAFKEAIGVKWGWKCGSLIVQKRKGAEKLNLEEVLARQTTMSIRSERQGEDKWENE